MATVEDVQRSLRDAMAEMAMLRQEIDDRDGDAEADEKDWPAGRYGELYQRIGDLDDETLVYAVLLGMEAMANGELNRRGREAIGMNVAEFLTRFVPEDVLDPGARSILRPALRGGPSWQRARPNGAGRPEGV